MDFNCIYISYHIGAYYLDSGYRSFLNKRNKCRSCSGAVLYDLSYNDFYLPQKLSVQDEMILTSTRTFAWLSIFDPTSYVFPG